VSEWRITRLRGQFALTFDRDGRRHRHTLNTDDPREAQRIAPALFAELNRPKGRTVADLWASYILDKAEKPIATTMKYTGKAILPHFGRRDGEDITKVECEAYTAARRKQGRSDGSIHTELGHLRTVLVWAQKRRLIGHAPEIARPPKPDPKDRYLSRTEVRAMMNATGHPHIRLAMHLMLATAARVTAVLDLTWTRVDFERRLIHLRDPEDTARRKGRATVPINDTLFAALQEARKGALSDYVVEWGGERVKSIKRGVATAAKLAGIEDVSPHVFRHTAAVWLAEAGVPMAEISQYLGHTNLSMTIKVYARYSPDHLRGAASALDLGGPYEVPSGRDEPRNRNKA
jgi:integrase